MRKLYWMSYLEDHEMYWHSYGLQDEMITKLNFIAWTIALQSENSDFTFPWLVLESWPKCFLNQSPTTYQTDALPIQLWYVG